MEKLPKDSFVYLRGVVCGLCGRRVRIVKNLDPTNLIYQEEHASKPDELCRGSDLEVSETIASCEPVFTESRVPN